MIESPAAPVLATGLAALDALLPGGGLPEGRIVELTGPRAGGKLSLALAIAARRLARGEPAALVDPEGTIHPDVWREPAFERLLVVRGGGVEAALAATAALLETAAFPFVALDLPGRGLADRRAPALVRLARQARAAAATLVLLSETLPWRDGLTPLAGLRLGVRRGKGPFRHLLEVTLARSRAPGEGRRALLDLAPAAAGGPAPTAPLAA